MNGDHFLLKEQVQSLLKTTCVGELSKQASSAVRPWHVDCITHASFVIGQDYYFPNGHLLQVLRVFLCVAWDDDGMDV